MTGSGDAKSTDRTGDAPRPFTDLTNLRPPMSPTKLRYDEDQPSFQMSPATEPPASPLLNTTGPPSRDSGAGSVPGTPTSVRARVHPYQREVRCNSSTDVNLVRFARQQQQQQMPSMSRSLPGRSKLVPAQSQSLTPTYFATAPMDLDGSSSSRDRCNSDLGHTIRPPPHSSHSSSPIGMCNSGMEGASRNSVGSDEVFTENVMLPVACADDECESQHSSNSGSTRRSRSNTYGSDGRSRVPNTPLRQHTPLTPKQSQADFSGRRSVCGTPSLDGDSNDPTGPVFRTVEDDCSLADIFDGDDAMSAWHSDDCLQEQQQLNFQQQMQSRHGVFPQHHSYDSLSSLSRSDSLTTNFAAMSTVTPSQTPTPTRDMAKEQAMAAAISAPPSKLTSSPKLPRALIRSQTLHGRPSSPLTSVVEDTSMSMGAGRPARSYRSQECVASPSSSFADSSFVGSKWSSHVLPMPVQELQQHQQGSMLEEEESSTSTPARTTTAATATAAIIARIAKTETAGTVERTEDYGVTPLHHSPDIVAVPVPRCRRVQSCMFSSPATLFRAVSPTPNFTFGTFNAFNPSAPQPPAKAAMTPRDGSRTASEVYGSQSTLTGADGYDGLRHPGASSSAIQHMLTLRARASSMCEIGPTHEPIPHLLETVDEPQYSHNVNRTISPFTVHELIGGVHSDKFDYYVILDARFEYEFNGGHIANALNKYDPVECKAFVFGELLDYLKKENIDTLRCCIVIHCEFSHSRAPKMFDMLRQEDRNRNAAHYPLLTFPQMFLINTGYKGMFTEYPADCTPQSYLAMDDPAYTAERNACLDRWKSDTSKPKKRSRSQSCVYSHY